MQRRAGCKRISIRVSRTGRVTITYPWYVLRSRALAFAESKADWIIATRQRVLQATAQPTIESGYRTRFHTVRIEHGSRRSLQIGKEEVVITLKSGEEIGAEPTQEYIRGCIVETLRSEAHNHIPRIVDELAHRHGFRYNGITIKNMHSKWGSCSATDHLNFSLYLMRLPDSLIEFVVLHELCHTVHKNHSAQFHALLNSLCGGGEQSLNRALRAHGKCMGLSPLD